MFSSVTTEPPRTVNSTIISHKHKTPDSLSTLVPRLVLPLIIYTFPFHRQGRTQTGPLGRKRYGTPVPGDLFGKLTLFVNSVVDDRNCHLKLGFGEGWGMKP